tara:strand:+ start:5398 stop:6018 length:621 start_codon:yes stop_codon:yes gene_type:complete
MISKKVGLVLSHVFVREGEDHKFDWIESALIKYNLLDINFFIVLCGHGISPPQKILDMVDKVFWRETIMENQLGRGHPYFSIEGFKICKEASCEMTIKNRAYDYFISKDFLNKNLIVSEQTSLKEKIIGDLFLYGQTDYLLNWWSNNPWDYSTNGLANLYRNMPEDFVDSACFLTPKELGWKTFEDDCNLYWGEHKGYQLYGGIGL